MKMVQIFNLWVISLKRFRLFSQKVVSISPVRDALQRDIDKGKLFFWKVEMFGEKKSVSLGVFAVRLIIKETISYSKILMPTVLRESPLLSN